MALLRLLLPTAILAAALDAAIRPIREPLVTVIVTDATTRRAVPYPMICIGEFSQPVGPIGDSTGHVIFGGEFQAGALHLRVKAPEYLDFDTTATWPSTSEIQVRLKRRSGPPVTPRCTP